MQQTAEYRLKNDSDFFNGMLFGSINGQNSIAAANGTDSLAGADKGDGTGSPHEITLDTLEALGLYSGKELTGEATLKTEAWLYLAPSTRALKLVQLASGTHLEIIKIVAQYNKGQYIGRGRLYSLSLHRPHAAGQRCAGAPAAAL